MHVAGSAECARYDAKREPRERIAARGPNWRLFVISRKAGEDHFETMYTPFEVRGEFSGKPLDGFGAADDDFSRKYWALLTASIPDVRSGIQPPRLHSSAEMTRLARRLRYWTGNLGLACLFIASLAPCRADPAIHYAPAENLEHIDVGAYRSCREHRAQVQCIPAA